MAVHGRWRGWVGYLVLAFAVNALAGCSNGDGGAVSVGPEDAKSPTLALNNSNDAQATAPAAAESATARRDQPFSEACTVEINADSGAALPPTTTINQKNTGQLYEDVQRTWNDIKFVTPDGKKQTFVLELDIHQGATRLGTIEILMRPEVAPNHVRNFVALAQLKFYDGLRLDRVIRQQGEGDAAGSKLVLLEGGSPAEGADPASSHLGYWLRPEFSETEKHVEGTIGACLMPTEDNAETAACRFYLNLTAAPAMDGNFTIFGRIIGGLDVAQRVAETSVRDADGGPDQGRPVEPVVIRAATVRAMPVVE